MPKVYENVMPRSFLQQGIDAMKEAGVDFFGTDNAEDLPFGVPDEMATTRVDATEFEPLKMKALAAHATQVTVDGPFFALSDHVGSRAWGYEFYRVVRGTQRRRTTTTVARPPCSTASAEPGSHGSAERAVWHTGPQAPRIRTRPGEPPRDQPIGLTFGFWMRRTGERGRHRPAPGTDSLVTESYRSRGGPRVGYRE